jgi:flagellin
MTLSFTPFEVYLDGDDPDGVRVDFNFAVNGASPTSHSFDRSYVNALLGKTTGKIETADEMVTLLQSLLGSDWPDVIIEATTTTQISVRSDKGVDRWAGSKTRIGFDDIRVSIEPMAEQNFLDIDISAFPERLHIYRGYMNIVIDDAITAASKLGALKKRLDLQAGFTSELSDSIDRGIGQLVDADMNKTSSRLSALETQQQLAIQSLQIANSSPQSILQLFKN